MWLRLTLNPILPKLVSDNRQLPVFETEKSEFGGIDFYDYQICRREKFYRIATVL